MKRGSPPRRPVYTSRCSYRSRAWTSFIWSINGICFGAIYDKILLMVAKQASGSAELFRSTGIPVQSVLSIYLYHSQSEDMRLLLKRNELSPVLFTTSRVTTWRRRFTRTSFLNSGLLLRSLFTQKQLLPRKERSLYQTSTGFMNSPCSCRVLKTHELGFNRCVAFHSTSIGMNCWRRRRYVASGGTKSKNVYARQLFGAIRHYMSRSSSLQLFLMNWSYASTH